MKEIIKRTLVTIVIAFLFQIGKAITVLNVDTTLIKLSVASGNFIDIMSMLSGGSLGSFSIFALGVGPYISGSIVIQLGTMMIPKLKELSEEGIKGRKKLQRYERYLSIFVAIIQAYTVLALFENNYGILIDKSFMGYVTSILCLIAGMAVVMWMGDIVTVYGLGNGVSIIIFLGVISQMPTDFKAAFESISALENGTLWFIIYCIMFIVIVCAVIMIETAERRITIQQSNRVVNRTKGDFNYIPLKPNSSSVMPVIFASAFLTAPGVVLALFNVDTTKFNEFMSLEKASGLIIYALLIVVFSFFYTNIQVDVDHIAENFEKNGTYIPGVRPGHETRKYLSKVLNSITCLGALFLVAIAILPNIISILTGISSSAAIGGTGIIISVGVAINIYKNLKTMAQNRAYDNYRGF